ncbi:MAG: DNA mismatch repair protein MutS [Candidatus Omnitrophica bacterium]|nr:DNA mismatch repair protein MutS [Candidatus Omnitrophota bacterium]MCM8793459.1 DNA mismatch repair protein MutS [Candidatus Omnitrophota bacterium]
MSENFTPMINQYLKIKKDYSDSILLFRLGDFYEMFFEDAKLAARVLNIALTSREAGKNRRVPMCGVPYHAVDNYLFRLLNEGFKAVIVEQVEDPKLAKGIVKREVVRIITPGTLTTDTLLKSSFNNFIVSLNKKEGLFGLAFADISTGEFKITEIDSEEKFLAEIIRLEPKEILLPVSFKKDESFQKKFNSLLPKTVTYYEDWNFYYDTAYNFLTRHFKVETLLGFGCDGLELAIGCAGALLKYLEETQKTNPQHINRLSFYSISDFMLLDYATQRNLELVKNLSEGTKENTLFSVLDKTLTSMGKRLLSQWFLQPLKNVKEINRRLEAVKEFYENNSLRTGLRQKLENIQDLERFCSRISLKIANPKDLVSLANSLKIVREIKKETAQVKANFLKEIFQKLDCIEEVIVLIEKAIIAEPSVSIREGEIIKDGFNDELDQLREILRGGKSWIADLQERESQRTGISSLKVGFNKVFGYYIEVTKPNLKFVPSDYIRKQTLVNCERFITPELKEYEAKVLNAEEEIKTLEYKIFMDILEKISEFVPRIQETARNISLLDCFSSLAEVALRNHYVLPEVNEEKEIYIEEGRHPVIELNLETNRFVPNDTLLDGEENRFLIITGPNMAGKSTYIRQVALIVLMAQMGSFVPAKKAKIGIVDRIFTRIGAQDVLAKGLSTFMLEMTETANILNNATERSLIILDEVGRGTSTLDGLSIAWAVAEYIHNHLKARTLFATHYHELTGLANTLKGIKNYNISVKEWEEEVIFLYKLVEGGCDRSFGIHVARLAGVPQEVIKRAKEILSNLEINSITGDSLPKLAKTENEKLKEKQLDFFSNLAHPVIAELKKLDLNKLTPLEAMKKLEEWQRKIEVSE